MTQTYHVSAWWLLLLSLVSGKIFEGRGTLKIGTVAPLRPKKVRNNAVELEPGYCKIRCCCHRGCHSSPSWHQHKKSIKLAWLLSKGVWRWWESKHLKTKQKQRTVQRLKINCTCSLLWCFVCLCLWHLCQSMSLSPRQRCILDVLLSHERFLTSIFYVMVIWRLTSSQAADEKQRNSSEQVHSEEGKVLKQFGIPSCCGLVNNPLRPFKWSQLEVTVNSIPLLLYSGHCSFVRLRETAEAVRYIHILRSIWAKFSSKKPYLALKKVPWNPSRLLKKIFFTRNLK